MHQYARMFVLKGILPALALAMLCFASPSARATSSVSFESPHCSLLFEVGHVEEPVIASVQVFFAGRPSAPWVRSPHLRVRRFDHAAQWIEIEYINPGDPAMPPSFQLFAHGRNGTIRFAGQSESGIFSWEM